MQLKFLLFLLLILSGYLKADEFDGGIPIDQPINDRLEKSLNIEFIKRNAKASAHTGKIITECGGAGNQTFGPGTDLRNATIVNLSDNKGATSVCKK